MTCVSKEYEIKTKNGTGPMNTAKTDAFIGLWLEHFYLGRGGGRESAFGGDGIKTWWEGECTRGRNFSRWGNFAIPQ